MPGVMPKMFRDVQKCTEISKISPKAESERGCLLFGKGLIQKSSVFQYWPYKGPSALNRDAQAYSIV